MENVTHSLVGAALAELALPRDASNAQRRLFFVAGIVAANLPDADLVYTRITPPPLGYLLHHRGHTHTIVGAAVLAIAIWLVVRLIPPTWRLVARSPRRFGGLIVAALASHIVLDSWNSYGVHPFWPVDNRWYYGDAINIIEPWLWLFLGISAVMNTRDRRGRPILAATVIALPLVVAWVRMVSVGAVVALAAGGIVLGTLAWRMPARTRAISALAATALFVSALFGLSRLTRDVSLASLRAGQQGEIVDLVLSPNAAAPLCWRALAIEKNERAGEYVLRRGAVSLFAGWVPRMGCAEPAAREQTPGGSRSAVVWFSTVQEPLARLRQLARDDCWVRAWLQFGRAPTITEGEIADLRFGSGGFTAMPIPPSTPPRACPPHLAPWSMPRADLLASVLEK